MDLLISSVLDMLLRICRSSLSFLSSDNQKKNMLYQYYCHEDIETWIADYMFNALWYGEKKFTFRMLKLCFKIFLIRRK